MRKSDTIGTAAGFSLLHEPVNDRDAKRIV